MYHLDKLHVAQASKEFNRSHTAMDAQELGKVFDQAASLVASASLYGLEAGAYIKKIVLLYVDASDANIASGRVTEEWTRLKKKAAHQLEAIVEKILEQKLSFSETFKAELIVDIDNYKKEYLEAERSKYFDHSQWKPEEGNFEKTYIPILENCLETIHRVYCLYQLDNLTNADLRSRTRDEKDVILIQTAHEFAKSRVLTLLRRLEKEKLKEAEAILDTIEKQIERLFLVSSAAEGQSAKPQDGQSKISKTRLLAVDGAFAVELHKKEVQSEEAALRNIGTYAKRAAAVTLGGVGAAASAVGHGVGYLAEGAMNAITGPLEGKEYKAYRERQERNNESDISDDEEDMVITNAKPRQPIPLSPLMPEHQLDWEYEGGGSSATTRGYSPSTSTAQISADEQEEIAKKNNQSFDLT